MIPTVELTSTIFFFNDTATTEIYTLSLHDALPIYPACPRKTQCHRHSLRRPRRKRCLSRIFQTFSPPRPSRSEEHTSELQSRLHLVCRLLLEKKNTIM